MQDWLSWRMPKHDDDGHHQRYGGGRGEDSFSNHHLLLRRRGSQHGAPLHHIPTSSSLPSALRRISHGNYTSSPLFRSLSYIWRRRGRVSPGIKRQREGALGGGAQRLTLSPLPWTAQWMAVSGGSKPGQVVEGLSCGGCPKRRGGIECVIIPPCFLARPSHLLPYPCSIPATTTTT